MNRRWVPLLAACLGGCVIELPGPTQHDFQTVYFNFLLQANAEQVITYTVEYDY